MGIETPVWLSWSTGKDSAWSYFLLSKSEQYKPTTIFTTVNEKYHRVAMHGTQLVILTAQAERLGVDLKTILIPDVCDNDVYKNAMFSFMQRAKEEKIKTFAFGDLFLQDIREYRESQMKSKSMQAIFPIWGMNTKELAYEMIDNGFKAIINCIDTKQISEEFLGREFNQDFIRDLPETVDPCGENGEFHTCVYDSPSFSKPISLKLGEKKVSQQFQFIDLMVD